VPRSIGLPLPADEETNIDETSDEDDESDSDSSDVEKSVMSEDRDDDGGLAISMCAVGPLLSMNVQCPRSWMRPTTQKIVFRSAKCGEGLIVEYSQKPSSFSVASQVLMCARRMVSA